MLSRVSVREDAIISYIAPGIGWGILGVIDVLDFDSLPLSIVATALLAVDTALMVVALIRHFEKDDEQTLAASGSAGRWAVKYTMIALMLLLMASILLDGLSAKGLVELIVAVLSLSYGITFLHLMGREDAYLED